MRALAVLALFFVDAPALAPAETLAPDAETRWVTFDLTDASQIGFSMLVDGRPVRAILDTGVAYSAISRRFATAAKMPVRIGGPGMGIGGTIGVGWVDAHTVALGALSRRGARLAVTDLPDQATGGAIDALIGQDLLGHYALDIDYAAKRFRLLPSGRLPFDGTSLPLRAAGAPRFYVTSFSIGDRPLGRVMVDTGDGNALTVSARTWRALPFAALPVTSTISFGLGGPVVTGLAVVPVLESAGQAARDVPVGIEPEGGFTQSVGFSARIGSGFLRRYRVLLDPMAGRMVLRPDAGYNARLVRSTSGLIVQREGARLMVVHVMRGGPGEATGWRAGDRICLVDGAPIAAEASLNWPIGEPGRTVALGLCGGATRTLTLRTFY